MNPYGQMQPCLSVRHIAFDLADGTITDGLAVLRQRLSFLKAPENSVCDSCSQRIICNACPVFSYLENGIEQKSSGFQCQVTLVRGRLLKQQEDLMK